MFIDAVASLYDRNNLFNIIDQSTKEIFCPITLGGGIRSLEDIDKALKSGADKVAINTAALLNPDLVKQAAERFGSQCIVVAVDAKQVSGKHEERKWEIFTHGGRKATGKDAIDWVKKIVASGRVRFL